MYKILCVPEISSVSSQSYSVSCGWWVCSLQRARDLRAGGEKCMRASNLRAYARRDLARMTVRPESARISVRYFVFQSFFTVILCKLWLVGL